MYSRTQILVRKGFDPSKLSEEEQASLLAAILEQSEDDHNYKVTKDEKSRDPRLHRYLFTTDMGLQATKEENTHREFSENWSGKGAKNTMQKATECIEGATSSISEGSGELATNPKFTISKSPWHR